MTISIRRSAVAILLTLIATAASAQIITTTPLFPSRNKTVTFTYDATQGNAQLTGITPVYAHTGLITTQSIDGTDWKRTQGNWGTADSHMLMTDLGGNKHSITYNINSFYNATSGDTIKELGFVFRNSNGSVVGRAADGQNIFVKLYDDSLHCAFFQPQQKVLHQALNSTMNFFCAASENCNLKLFGNGNLLAQTFDDSLYYNNFTFTTYGLQQFVLSAATLNDTVFDTINVFVNQPVTYQNLPSGTIDGINYLSDSSVILRLFAPNKNFVYVIGDFNNWQTDQNYFMHCSTDSSTWWLQIDHLTPGKEYIFQYWVDGAIKIGDPYADKVSDPWNDRVIPAQIYPSLIPYPTGKTQDIATVLQTAQTPYNWQNISYQKPNKHNLVVYELLARDFVTLHYWKRITDSLSYLQRLGVNAIELMPVMEFESNESWGYNPNYFFAPDKYYGPKNDLKKFIEECHKRNIAVILDMVVNHAFGTCPLVKLYWDENGQQPAANSPWFNQQPKHPFNVGYDFNHESNYTKKFFDRLLRYWVSEFHADGFRLDLTKGVTQKYTGNDVGAWAAYDASRIALLERLVDSVWAFDPSAIMIFEHLADNSEEIELANHGIMLWGNMNAAYNEATMGYITNSDLSWGSYKQRGWNSPNLVTYMESHDEERLMYKNLTYGNVTATYNAKILDTALQRMEAAGVLFFPLPGPKMIWQFGERGYDITINKDCRICPKPMFWNYMNVPSRLHQFKVWSALIKLKLADAPFQTTDFDISMGGSVKRIKLTHNLYNVIAIANFDVTDKTAYASFHHTGKWYEYFTGDSLTVSDVNMPFTFHPAEYRLYTDKKLAAPDLAITGIPAIDFGSSVKLFPNPASGKLFIEGWKEEGVLKLFSTDGKLMFQSAITGNGFHSIDLDENLPVGLYFCEISGPSVHLSGRLLIQQP
ncbi:MAG: alpha-amylase family glycosyl hydrolase [Chitinophagales bacterium]